jgi:hypothetical protein
METKYNERGRNNLSNVSTLEEAYVYKAELLEEQKEEASVFEAKLSDE